MTREERINLMKHLKYNRSIGGDYTITDKDADEIIKTLEQEPCEDVISRKAVLDCFTATKLKKFDFILYAREEIKKLPSVTPAQKTGHWRAVYQGDEIINYRCSECELGDTNGSTNLYGWDYCRRCGAKMKEVEDA